MKNKFCIYKLNKYEVIDVTNLFFLDIIFVSENEFIFKKMSDVSVLNVNDVFVFDLNLFVLLIKSDDKISVLNISSIENEFKDELVGGFLSFVKNLFVLILSFLIYYKKFIINTLSFLLLCIHLNKPLSDEYFVLSNKEKFIIKMYNSILNYSVVENEKFENYNNVYQKSIQLKKDKINLKTNLIDKDLKYFLDLKKRVVK